MEKSMEFTKGMSFTKENDWLASFFVEILESDETYGKVSWDSCVQDACNFFFSKGSKLQNDWRITIVGSKSSLDFEAAAKVLESTYKVLEHSRQEAVSKMFNEMFGRNPEITDYKVSLVFRDEFPACFKQTLRIMYRRERLIKLAKEIALYLSCNCYRYSMFNKENGNVR